MPQDPDAPAETDPLLGAPTASDVAAKSGSVVDPDSDDRMAQDVNIVLPRRRWIMEPVLLLFCIGMLSQAPVLSQYVYYKVGKQYNGTGNSSRAFVCNSSAQTNSSEHSMTNRIQSEASSWTLYRSTVSSLVALLVLPFYASSSDYFGRKPALLLPASGMALDAAGALLVVLLDLPLIGLVISAGVGALGGGFGTLLASVFSYLADTTTPKERPIRVTIVEGMFGISGTVMELIMGWWIKLMGYTIPLMFSVGALLANLLYVIFLVPEVRLHRRAAGTGKLRLLAAPLANIVSLFSISGRLSLMLALLLASLAIYTASFMGSNVVNTLYQMNYPFCLDSVFIGYLGSAKIVGYQIGAVFGLLVLRKYLRVKTVGLIVLGLLSSAAGSLLTGLAQSTATLFVASAVALFAMLAVPMFRAFASQISPPQRQGALFGCIGVLEVAGNLAGSTAFITLYKSTLTWMPGFVYLVMAATTSLSLLFSSACLLIDTCCAPHKTSAVDEAASSSDESEPAGVVNN